MVRKVPTKQMEKKLQQLFFREVTNNMLLDNTAPIIPFWGFGNIKLYSTRDELSDLFYLKK